MPRRATYKEKLDKYNHSANAPRKSERRMPWPKKYFDIIAKFGSTLGSR